MLDAPRAIGRPIFLCTIAALAALLPVCTTVRPALAGWNTCAGDCDRDLNVQINDLVLGVNLVLGTASIDACPAYRACNGDGTVTVNCVIRAVGAALNGCAPTVPNPTVEGPITTGNGAAFVAGTGYNLADVGYSDAEYFVAGTAAAYANVAPLTSDGVWTVERTDTTAAYETRIIVYRPTDPAQFNGTVIMEWLNVSGGLDAAADWLLGHTELIRKGYAYVGVSAQYVGIHGGGSLGIAALPLKVVDPVRYAPLHHPGDSFSYDMFSQVAHAILRPAGIRPLGDLPVKALIATGDSQSAFRLVTYIDGIHPLVDLFDGFLVHSRSGTGAALSEAPQTSIPAPTPLFIRGDLDAPVMTFQTETDLTLLGWSVARQPDTDRVRAWEVAAAAHADTYTLQVGRMDRGDSPDIADIVLINNIFTFQCGAPLNSGPHHWVFKAAVAALNAWVRDGIVPPTAPPIEIATEGTTVTVVRDEHGNARGGIRTPYVDAPIAAFTGEQTNSSVVCRLFGSTVLFDQTTLAALYPDHASYVAAFNASTDQAVADGFLLPPDAALLKTNAEQSDIGG